MCDYDRGSKLTIWNSKYSNTVFLECLYIQNTYCFRYTKTTAGVGVSAQKYNPEVRIDRPDTIVYTLADKLRSVRRVSSMGLVQYVHHYIYTTSCIL